MIPNYIINKIGSKILNIAIARTVNSSFNTIINKVFNNNPGGYTAKQVASIKAAYFFGGFGTNSQFAAKVNSRFNTDNSINVIIKIAKG